MPALHFGGPLMHCPDFKNDDRATRPLRGLRTRSPGCPARWTRMMLEWT
ncbi:hypothetical protein ACEWB4_01135 [Sphingobium sp. sgz301303]